MVVLIIIYGCDTLIFHPSKGFFANHTIQKANPKDIFFQSGDGEKLHGWFFSAVESKGTVLVFHGNAENITSHSNSVLWMVMEGFNVLIIDYRGYGISTGSPDLDGIHRDGLAAFEYLLSRPDIDGDRIALLGQSIGGSVATYVAATAPGREKVNE